ncbi:palmitoyltransferase ZDHHC21-like [Littorina saxatilis]|uniref:palmitoyltransferase ZDHHC21-like n=1 Tax=Littorina saxatilis TaxID=31220 RepID=UPI0038B68A4C
MNAKILQGVSSIMPKRKLASSEYSDKVSVTTWPLIGRIHIVKDRSGQMQVGGILLYWVYGTFCTLFLVLLPQYYDQRIPASLVICFMSVCILCLLSLLKASLTNPGRIPLITEDSNIDTSDWTFCRNCNRQRPKRAHHCRRCGQCVMRMDHHCPWINNCVGEENHFAFTLLLFYSFLFGTFSVTLTYFHFWVWPKCVTCDKESFFIKHSIWFVYVLVLLGLNMAALMFLQLLFQHFNLLLDRTTLENMQAQPSPENTTLRKVYTAYRDHCGRGSLLFWWWPCRRRIPLLQHPFYSHV